MSANLGTRPATIFIFLFFYGCMHGKQAKFGFFQEVWPFMMCQKPWNKNPIWLENLVLI